MFLREYRRENRCVRAISPRWLPLYELRSRVRRAGQLTVDHGRTTRSQSALQISRVLRTENGALYLLCRNYWFGKVSSCPESTRTVTSPDDLVGPN
jgi:hypothetical protein